MMEISYAVIKRKRKQRYAIFFSVFLSILTAIIFITQNTNQKTTPLLFSDQSNTLSISGPWELSSLDPSKQGYVLMRMQLIETLLNVDASGNIIQGLATNWQVSNLGLQWDFIVRSGVFFHDGTTMDANAVVNSLKCALEKHSVLNKAQIIDIIAVSNSQVRIVLAKPYAALPALLTNYATAILAPTSYDEEGDIVNLYATGAYKLFAFALPHKLTVTKFDSYWGESAQISFATYLTGHRAESRILQAKSGEVDLAFTLDPAMLSQLTTTEHVRVQSDLIPRIMLIKLNVGHEFLQDLNVRKALSLAIDRHAIAKNVLKTEGSETSQLLPKSMSAWYLSDISVEKFNLLKAEQLLQNAGWSKNQNGKLIKDDKLFQLRMITYADRPELAIVATAIQAQWRKLGIDLSIDVTNSSMIPATHQDDSLEVALIARNFGFSVDPLPIINSDFSHGGADWGTMNWHNEQVDKAVDELIGITDISAFNREQYVLLTQKIATVLHEEMPVIPLLSYSQHTAVNKRVSNFIFDPFERIYFINQMSFIK